MKISPGSDKYCDSCCDYDLLPNQLIKATPTKAIYNPEINTQQQECPPPTPPRVQDLNLTTVIYLFAWSENKESFEICSIPQNGAVSGLCSDIRLTIQTGLGCYLVDSTYDNDCKYTDIAHLYIQRLYTRPDLAGNAPAVLQPQVISPKSVVCVGYLRVETSQKSSRTGFAVLVSPFPPPTNNATEPSSSSASSGRLSAQWRFLAHVFAVHTMTTRLIRTATMTGIEMNRRPISAVFNRLSATPSKDWTHLRIFPPSTLSISGETGPTGETFSGQDDWEQ